MIFSNRILALGAFGFALTARPALSFIFQNIPWLLFHLQMASVGIRSLLKVHLWLSKEREPPLFVSAFLLARIAVCLKADGSLTIIWRVVGKAAGSW